MQFCRLVENGIQKYLAIASETDKRDIYGITKSESGDADDTDIRWIDFVLSENLLEEVMDRAFEESKMVELSRGANRSLNQIGYPPRSISIGN
jgi:hypothetical protein